jgi:hypothetical protein
VQADAGRAARRVYLSEEQMMKISALHFALICAPLAGCMPQADTDEGESDSAGDGSSVEYAVLDDASLQLEKPDVVTQNATPVGADTNIARVVCNRSDFLELFNNTGALCFANAGDLNVAIFGVTASLSGNNAGFLDGTCRGGPMAGRPIRATFPKFARADFTTQSPCRSSIDVRHIHIN